MAAQKKLLIEIEGIDNDGKYGARSFKVPSHDDWTANLQTINKKINKKFQVEQEYGLEINGQSVKYDDPDGLAVIMKDIDVDKDELCFKIVDISEVGINNVGRKIVIHYNGQEFVYYVGQELSELDDDIYDEMYDAIKSAFKIKGKMGKIYENVAGKKLYCDDWDDLSELLEDKEDGEALDLYVEGKGSNAPKAKNKGPPSTLFKKSAPSPTKQVKQPLKKHVQDVDIDYSENPLYIWCNNNGLVKYFEKLSQEFEIMQPEELIELNFNISGLADDLGLKYGSKNRFIKAVNVLRSNQPTAQAEAVEAYCEGVPSVTKLEENDDDEIQPGNDELYTWCKQIGISKFYNALRKHIESPSDFTELTKTDINDLCAELQIKWSFKSKLKKAIQAIQSQNEKEEQKQPNETAVIAVIAQPFKPKRNLRGVVLVPCTKMEYKAPQRVAHRSKGSRGSKKKHVQTGFMAGAASIIKTVTNSFFPWDTKQPHQLHNRKEKKKVFSAPQHRVIGSANNKVLMIVGQTGAGKTTLINSMMNYVYGVAYEDPYRFRLIQEKPKKKGQAVSQTDHVSTYHIKHEQGWAIPYDLTIIDTPGFADTRGIEKDKQIVADIRYFFEKILDGIDGVCFVVKSTDNRLTGAQNYVFNNVLNLWAKDLLENIFILLTFCDGKRPPVMDALKQHQTLRHCKVFRLNNSAYSEDPTNRDPNEDDSFDQMFWNMGTKCFANFFQKLNETQTKSINECREVLKQREAIQVKIEHISNSVDNALAKQQNIAVQERFVIENKKKIIDNQEVFHEETERKWVKIPSTSSIITTCFHHQNQTCHKACKVNDKRDCCVMNADMCCTVCGCHVDKHGNRPYYYEWKSFTEQVSDYDKYPTKKDLHEAAKLGLNKAEMLLRTFAKQKKRLEQEVNSMIADILGFRNYLEKIALRPTLTTVGDYIDQLIENEEDSPSRDPVKIRQLKQYKNQEKIIQQILQGGDQTKIDDLFGLRTKK